MALYDENYDPQPTDDFYPTPEPTGSLARVEIMRQRFTDGLPLWHKHDTQATVRIGSKAIDSQKEPIRSRYRLEKIKGND